MLLAIDTSTRYAGVLLWAEGRGIASYSWHSKHNHTAELMPAIQHLLQKNKTQIRDLRGIALALGPGGFSALRVGMSVAKGLALAMELPLVGVSSLEMEAYPLADVGRPICPVLDMGRQEVAWAQFQVREGRWCKIWPEALIGLHQIAEAIPRGAVLCGEGVLTHSALLKEALDQKATVVEYSGPAPRLWALASLGDERLEGGAADDAATLQPLYLRRPSVTTPNPPTKIRP